MKNRGRMNDIEKYDCFVCLYVVRKKHEGDSSAVQVFTFY